jgi:hypothetical protein
MTNPTLTADCLYVCGDSWTHGSELIDPTSNNPDHFASEHDQYRRSHYWPALVARQLGLELVDGSAPGASNDRILRVTMYDVARLVMEGRRPFVVIAWSQLQRFELPDGPKGEFWRSFVNPRMNDTPRVATDIWKMWSSDRTDVVKWLQQIISLDAFLKINQVDYLSTTVFNQSYRLYNEYCYDGDPFFKPYLTQIRQHVNLSKHSLNFAMDTFLGHYSGIEYGPGGHPLARGHEMLAEQILAQIGTRFQIQRQEDQTSAT